MNLEGTRGHLRDLRRDIGSRDEDRRGHAGDTRRVAVGGSPRQDGGRPLQGSTVEVIRFQFLL